MSLQDPDQIVVVGAGLAGLAAALAAAPRKILLIAEAPLGEGCSSAWAQGGMAAALSPGDDPAFHSRDTIQAGAGLVDPDRAILLAREAPLAVRDLADLGAPFDRTPDGGFAQSLEAAHSHARVARMGGDQAGQAIMAAAIRAVREASHITVWTGPRLTGLLQAAGSQVSGVIVTEDGRETQIPAAAVILATGGIGGLYAVTTTPAGLLGDGLALAALAGAQIADPEFVQFHPTAMDLGRDPAPLATEALRGEGARLVNASGQAFMAGYHPQGDLAPRDIVARAIHAEREAGRGAFLDARAAICTHFPVMFPAVFAACQSAGIDPRIEPIPVAPACHYPMGGILTDAQGATSLPGLLAVGECASTGIHGANRLASNSLVEAAVFGRRAGRLARTLTRAPTPLQTSLRLQPLAPQGLRQLRQSMSRHAGVIRDREGLTALTQIIDALIRSEGQAGALVTARMIAQCALDRLESRGAHFRTDHPEPAPLASRTIFTLKAGDFARMAA